MMLRFLDEENHGFDVRLFILWEGFYFLGWGWGLGASGSRVEKCRVFDLLGVSDFRPRVETCRGSELSVFSPSLLQPCSCLGIVELPVLCRNLLGIFNLHPRLELELVCDGPRVEKCRDCFD